MRKDLFPKSLLLDARADKANRVTWIGLVINTVLTIFKLAAGIIGNSAAMVADAFHSLSDFATDLVVLFSFRIIRKPPDKSHHYGHGKVETLWTVIIGGALVLVGLRIFWSGTATIIDSFRGHIPLKPGWIAFVAAIVSILSKEWLYQYTVRTGKEIDSKAVIANAWHHRSDAFSSIGTMLGIGGAILLGESWRILDPLAAVIVSFFIIHIAVLISKTGIDELLECSLGESTEQEIIRMVRQIPGIDDAHGMKSRKIGNATAIDLHIEVNDSMTVTGAHDIATLVEDAIIKEYGENTYVNVHVEPSPTSK